MNDTSAVAHGVSAARSTRGASWLVGRWSSGAALRAVRAAVILPALLAITVKVIGNPQMATFAAFGTFANLVLAAFGGSRWDKLVAHLGLGLAGSALLCIGTAVHATTALAAIVTLVVSFVVFLAGASGPNVAAGGLAAMLAYVLAAASPGVTSMIPSRLAGWWLATVVAGLAVVATSGRSQRAGLGPLVASAASALGAQVSAVATGANAQPERLDAHAAQARLHAAFNASPFRPTGLTAPDQALGHLVELLEWVSSLVDDAVAEQGGVMGSADRELLACAGEVLTAVGAMLSGHHVTPDIARLEHLRVARANAIREADGDEATFQAEMHAAFHTRTLAVAVRSVAADGLIAAGRASARDMGNQRLAWLPHESVASADAQGPQPLGGRAPESQPGSQRVRRFAGVAGPLLVRHASIRSVWVRNSLRSALAVTAAVTVADVINVQHGFWVVLGTLSVLRTTATATGGTALSAVGGTAVGFLIGAAVLLAVGTNDTVLWAVLPIAVLLAAYAPGVAPFAVGQAAFTVLLVVLYNLLVPVGWRVGVIRVEDIAIGCGISLVVGALVWPRGTIAVVADDLYDAFVSAGGYLVQSTQWALGHRDRTPDQGRGAIVAGLRLDDALQAVLTEPGPTAVAEPDLWALVAAAQRLRLTSATIAELPPPPTTGPIGEALDERAQTLAQWYGSAGSHIRHGRPPVLAPLGPWDPLAPSTGPVGHRWACQIYVEQHLRHLHLHLRELIEPADHLEVAVSQPWWRRPGAGQPPDAPDPDRAALTSRAS